MIDYEALEAEFDALPERTKVKAPRGEDSLTDHFVYHSNRRNGARNRMAARARRRTKEYVETEDVS